VTPENFPEVGHSFLLRGIVPSRKKDPDEPKEAMEKIDPAAAIIEAKKVVEKKVENPLFDEAAPLELEIRYDGQKVPLLSRDGEAFVKEPIEGQKVSLVVRRKGNPQARYKVVLKVNGLNTIARERLPNNYCRGWVMEPGVESFDIKGFQIDNDTAQEFMALSRAVSREKEVYYGADVGTISLAVFTEQRKKDPPKVPPISAGLENENVQAVQIGKVPSEMVASLDSLQTALRESIKVRGIFEGMGNPGPNPTTRVEFIPDPTPIMSAIVTYYRP
jgi:hypothetical protein